MNFDDAALALFHPGKATAVFSLARVLGLNGRLVLSTRANTDDALPVGKLILLLEAGGFAVTEHRDDYGGGLILVSTCS